MKTQRIRKALLITSLLLFPITIWYFSPYLIIQGALEHVMNGSFIIFCLMLFGSIFFGRFFCSYLCPMGGLQECTMLVNDKHPKQKWRNSVKYVIWVIWMIAVVICYIFGKGDYKIDPFYMTDHGISISDIYNYVIYYGIILLIFVPAICFGKRVACHYYCWMAPFMVIGTKIGQFLHVPQLHIRVEKEKCISCKNCNKNCPMSLDVAEMVKKGQIRSAECIQCGACVDSCPRKVLSYSMKPVETKKKIRELENQK